jgi:hypothetical protein
MNQFRQFIARNLENAIQAENNEKKSETNNNSQNALQTINFMKNPTNYVCGTELREFSEASELAETIELMGSNELMGSAESIMMSFNMSTYGGFIPYNLRDSGGGDLNDYFQSAKHAEKLTFSLQLGTIIYGSHIGKIADNLMIKEITKNNKTIIHPNTMMFLKNCNPCISTKPIGI